MGDGPTLFTQIPRQFEATGGEAKNLLGLS